MARNKGLMQSPSGASRRVSPELWRRIRIGAAVLALLLVGGAVGLWASLPDVRPLAARAPTTTAFIELRRREAEEAGRPFALSWTWRPLGRISPYLRRGVILTEDAKFWKHEGVDWSAIEEAAERNWEKGRIAVGGSTITQQLAKNLYLSPSKNPVRKLRELLIARRLEAHLSKERILELYLNVAEWGDGVFGAEAAARRWFGCPAADLAAAQAARMAVALPNPRQRAPSVRSRDLDRRAARLVHAMWRQRLMDAAAYEQALAALGVPVPTPPASGSPAIAAPGPVAPDEPAPSETPPIEPAPRELPAAPPPAKAETEPAPATESDPPPTPPGEPSVADP